MIEDFNKTMLEHLRQNSSELRLAHWEDSSITIKADEQDYSESLQRVFHDFNKDTFYENELSDHIEANQRVFVRRLLDKLPASPAYSDLVNLKMSYLYNRERSRHINGQDLIWAVTIMNTHCVTRTRIYEAWDCVTPHKRELDDEICKRLIKENALCIFFLPAYFKDSKVVFEAVKQNWLVYALLPFQLRNEKALLIEALKQEPQAFFYAPRELRTQIPDPINIMINNLL